MNTGAGGAGNPPLIYWLADMIAFFVADPAESLEVRNEFRSPRVAPVREIGSARNEAGTRPVDRGTGRR